MVMDWKDFSCSPRPTHIPGDHMILDSQMPLLGFDDYLEKLEPGSCTVNAELVDEYKEGIFLEALATPPVELEAEIPESFQYGHRLKLQGPHGSLEVRPPVDALPGSIWRYRLAPPPEFRLEVPRDVPPGSTMTLSRWDGTLITVPIPEDLQAGDMFDVTEPVVMVRVPDGARPGDAVIFRPSFGPSKFRWCRARVPKSLLLGKYFAARPPSLPNVRFFCY